MTRLSLFALVLAACMSSTHDVRAPLDADLERRMGRHVSFTAFDGAIDTLLKTGLDEQKAVQIALANNRRMRAALADLGIARGELGAALGLGPVDVDASLRFGTFDSTTGTRPCGRVCGLSSKASVRVSGFIREKSRDAKAY